METSLVKRGEAGGLKGLGTSRSSGKRRLDQRTYEAVSAALKECEAEVMSEFGEEWLRPWLKNLRKGIERRFAGFGQKKRSCSGALAAACAASRARESVLKAQAREEAMRVLELRADAIARLNQSQSTLLKTVLVTPAAVPEKLLQVDTEDIRQLAVHIRDTAQMAVEVTEHAKREIRDLSSLIDAVENDDQPLTKKRRSSLLSTEDEDSTNAPANRLARHLAQETESPADFLTSPYSTV